jgi:hypothetical protein
MMMFEFHKSINCPARGGGSVHLLVRIPISPAEAERRALLTSRAAPA